MDSEISENTTVHNPPGGSSHRAMIADYLELAKARLGALVVLTAFVGYILGARGEWSLTTGLAAVIGTALSAFGANILNQWWEVERDRRMLQNPQPAPARWKG